MQMTPILKEARRIVDDCGTRDPVDIAEYLDIKILHRNNFTDLLGMYSVIEGYRYIFLNANIEEWLSRIIIAHEIGHDRFHQYYATAPKWLEDDGISSVLRGIEREANIFTAEVLIPDEWILEKQHLNLDWSFDMLAAEHETHPHLLAVKFDIMRYEGYDVCAPYQAPSDFLRRIHR